MYVWNVSEEEREKIICATGRFFMHAGWYRDHPERGPEGPFDTKEEAEMRDAEGRRVQGRKDGE